MGAGDTGVNDTIVRHVAGRSVEAAGADGDPQWRYVYGGVAKPYIHPLCTPAGVPITGFQPHSHPWHRGVWFTIKYVNGENYWEEGEEAGAAGHGTQVTVAPPVLSHDAADAAVIRSDLRWTMPDRRTVVAEEVRSVAFRPVDGALALDWSVSLTAMTDLVLDRTPFTTWGGYGGMSARLTRGCRRSRMLLPDGTTSERPAGETAPWCDLAGDLDGGVRAAGGVAVFDHTGNPRHPSPWYGAAGSMNFLNAAFLFHERMRVPEGETLAFRYRILVHDGLWEVDRLQEAYDRWVAA